jgi:hypothetical protein
MLTLIRNGGVPMLFILAFGLIGLGSSVYFSIAAKREIRGFVRWMMMTTFLAVLAGTVADIGATCTYVANQTVFEARTLVEGLGESMSPGIMGLALLTLTAMFVAVAERRIAAKYPIA